MCFLLRLSYTRVSIAAQSVFIGWGVVSEKVCVCVCFLGGAEKGDGMSEAWIEGWREGGVDGGLK